ncbi:DUF5706 domain-containing protein [Streptomyces sp. B-S-A8]|uniref:DUF5706 domain-containing protein n=1 Tax=Streptomyces solicavernae TaxID=3043614 RepID=A0ABT6RMW9_9ACTN|nr:Pycsar system effector family protein [Streptomyces sp. B-S-A8]MDI3385775.1 DUF5706 domain-containing protein [Streptomyces sp. B-S-A8]
MLADLRAEIGRADSKASVLVAALGLTVGVFSGRLAGSDWSPRELSLLGALLWWPGVLALALALLAMLLAVLPRYRRGSWTPGNPLTYFGDIQRAVQAGKLADALDDTTRAPTAALLSALADTSRIAVRKHHWIRTGLISFCGGTALVPIALLVG